MLTPSRDAEDAAPGERWVQIRDASVRDCTHSLPRRSHGGRCGGHNGAVQNATAPGDTGTDAAVTQDAGPFTIPNLLSLIRILALPVFVWLVATDRFVVAAAVLAAISATDFVDGKIARAFNQVSEIGKLLDPVADRVVVVVAVLTVVWKGGIVPGWLLAVVLVREVAVSLGVIILGLLGAARVDVRFVGKVGSFATMTSLPAFILLRGVTGFWHDAAAVVAWGAAAIGVVCGYTAAVLYIADGRRALAEGRAAREQAQAGEARA